MSTDGQPTKRRRNIAENYNRPSRVHERYRQTDKRQTYGRAIAYNTSISNVNVSLRSVKTCTLTSRSRLESYKRLVSKF